MKKPVACQGCPMYQKGDGFVPDEIIPGATIDVWLQNPGQSEEAKAKPATGATGEFLNAHLLPAAGLERGKDVNVRNVLRCRYSGTNDLPPESILKPAVTHCRVHDSWFGSTEIEQGAQVSVACGSLAWRLFNGPGTITDWRGFKHPDKAVIATLHPADLFRNPKMKLPVMMDFAKVDKYKKGVWPREVPPFLVCRGSSNFSQVHLWFDRAMEEAPFLVMDTEFTRDTRYLLTLGLGYPGGEGLQVWFTSDYPAACRAQLRDRLRMLVRRIPVVFQNTMADVPVLEKGIGLRWSDYSRVDDTMLAHAVLWSEWPHTLEYLASIYGEYPKMKHLSQSNPELYNWGDVLDTISVWQGVDKELTRDPQSRAIYETQSLPLVPVLLKRAGRGIRLDQERVREAITSYENNLQAASRIAQAHTGWEINIGSDQQLKKYCYEWNKYPIQYKKKKVSIDGDAVSALRSQISPYPDLEQEGRDGLGVVDALDRIAQGADPVLEARVIYADADQVLSHFLLPLKGLERCYPSMKIHAQASGRWSITDPPLQQFPKELHELFIPDPGEIWIGWDYDQIELRLLAALAQDEPYLEAFEKGWDVHTANACDIFELRRPTSLGKPESDTAWVNEVGWTGGEDIRRTFAKRFVYRLNYGGDPRMAGDIPGAKQLGLGSKQLVAASNRYLAAHPRLAAWRVKVAADAQTTRVSRTFMGRRRRLLGDDQGVVREAFNHPMQGGVADILNTVSIRIAQALPSATIVYTVHDAAWWAIPEMEVENGRETIQSILAEPFDVGGVPFVVPVKWKKERRGY